MRKKISMTLIVFGILATVISFSDNNDMMNAMSEEENLEVENFEAEKTLPKNHEITTMDQDGNIMPSSNTVEEEKIINPKSNDEPNGNLRDSKSISFVNGIVDFQTKNSEENTNYTEVSSGRLGYTNGNYGADAAYLEHSSDGKSVKFIQSGVIGWVAAKDVRILDFNSPSVMSYNRYVARNNRLYHDITTNISNSGYASSIDVGPKQSYMVENRAYFSYDGHYFYSTFNEMITDYRAGSYEKSINKNVPYYNYYQYLSHRTKTNFTYRDLDAAISRGFKATGKSQSKMVNMGAEFIKYQDLYGSNALLMMAVAGNESAWGTSSIALNKNNLFGHAAYDSSAGSSATGYYSPQLSIYSHAKYFISEGYTDPCDGFSSPNGFNTSVCLKGRYFGAHLGDKASGINVKYASDPYWGEKAAAIAWSVENNSTSVNKDSNSYSIGIRTTQNSVAIRNNALQSSALLYESGTTSNYPFIILGSVKGESVNGSNIWYRVQTDPTINLTRTQMIQDKGDYTFGLNYGYVHSSFINIVNQGKVVCTVDPGIKPVEKGVVYQVNVEDYCYQSWRKNGEMAGTNGLGKRIEGLKIDTNSIDGNLKYRTHVQDYGWLQWSENGAMSGKSGEDKRIEAIEISIDNQAKYDILYRVHIQDIGWQDWKKNGELAGTTQLSKRIEAIEIKLVEKVVEQNDIRYQTHVQMQGWQNWVNDGAISGTVNQNKRIEALRLELLGSQYKGSISYQTHIQDIGWQNWVEDGAISGTAGQSKRIEALRLKLSGDIAEYYDIYYRVNVQNIGWLDWAKNGADSGSAGYSYRLEALQVKLVPKNGTPPGTTGTPFLYNSLEYQSHVQMVGWQGYVNEGLLSGTTGQSKRVEAVKMRLTGGSGYSGDINYRTHIQDIGWQDWKKKDSISGTIGQSKRIEAIEIKLSGLISENYDVYYRAHVQGIGWLNWTSNGMSAGTSGYSYRMEAFEIKLVKKGEQPPVGSGDAFIKK